jgi:hypothetical protein
MIEARKMTFKIHRKSRNLIPGGGHCLFLTKVPLDTIMMYGLAENAADSMLLACSIGPLLG